MTSAACAFAIRSALDAPDKVRDSVKYAHVRDEVVALEYKPDAVVAIGIPVGIAVATSTDPINDKVARSVPVQTADNVE